MERSQHKPYKSYHSSHIFLILFNQSITMSDLGIWLQWVQNSLKINDPATCDIEILHPKIGLNASQVGRNVVGSDLTKTRTNAK